MFVRLVYESFRRQTRRKALVAIAVTFGAAVSTAMIGIATGIGDKITHELRNYGANLVVTPDADGLDVQIGSVNLKPASGGAYLDEAALPQIKGIFWGNNIAAFAPELPVNVRAGGREVTLVGTYFSKTVTLGKDQFTTGAPSTFPWWKVNGNWPKDDGTDVLVGEKLAESLKLQSGSQLTLAGVPHRVSGILLTGGNEDGQIVAPLNVAQTLAGEPGKFHTVYVSALLKPEDTFARRNPDTLSPTERDRWYCTPYPQSIALQLTEAIPHSHAEQIRQVAQSEGTILTRIEGLMLLITLAALLTSGLAVSAAMATAMFERRVEVGLMKALGAGHFPLSMIFVTESVLIACIGGLVGFGIGALLAKELGQAIFGSQIAVQPVLFPVVIALAIGVTFGGSAVAIRRAVKYDPVLALRGEA
ncbi:MAG TPA: ABC transporter permease [Terriglobales bacterium]|nr:ABC transporter permease [Terriglobales bacterium]